MVIQKAALSLAAAMAVTLLAGCATSSKAVAPATAPAAPATAQAPAENADPMAGMDKKFRDAAKSYQVVKRDDKTLYCRREMSIGSNIATMRCLTEGELRNQIQVTEELEARTRKGGGGNCTRLGNCGGGG